MSDLESRVAAALNAGVAAPSPTVGLADGARSRLRRRRRTRAVVGGVLAVLLVGVPVGVVAGDSSERSEDDAVVVDDGVVEGWRTVTYDGVQVDVPAGWTRLDMSSCEWEFVQLGPASADPCEQSEGVSFYDSATFDPASGPGLRGRSGYTGAGDRIAYVAADRDVAWRVLASAREEGETVPDLSRGATTVSQGGLQATVPVDQAGWSLRFVDRAGPRHPSVTPEEGRWLARVGRGDEAVVVDAATQALAEMIAGSVEGAGAGPRTPYLPRTETWGDLTLEVPADWATGDTCGNTGAPVVARADAWGCSGIDGYGVRIAPYPPAARLAVTDEMQRAEGPNWPAGSWYANVQVPGSTYVATVVTADRETGQRILESARRGSALNEWRTESWNGLSVEVPVSWELGQLRAWCARGGATRGAVERPGQADDQPRCGRPQSGFGVTFGPTGAFDPVYESGHIWQYERGDVEMYVDGSWLGYWYDEDRLVQVNAGDRATVQRVLDSLQVQPDRQ